MLTKEMINTFVELHNSLNDLGYCYQLSYGSYGEEFHSIVDVDGTIISLALISVSSEEDNRKLDSYRKLLIQLIEMNREVA